MPHTYMRTDRPRLERHDRAPGGVVEPHRHGARAFDAGAAEPQRRVLYRTLSCRMTAANDSIGAAFDSWPGRGRGSRGSGRRSPRSSAWPRGGPSRSARRSRRDGRWRRVRVAGRWWNAAATCDAGRIACTVRGDRTAWRDERLELVAHLRQRVGHRDDDLARELSATDAPLPPRRPTAWRGRRPRPSGALVVAGVEQERPIGILCAHSASTVSWPVLGPRTDRYFEAHRQRAE